MNNAELLSIIKKELEDNPKSTSIEISKKHKVPLHIVELFKKMISRKQKEERIEINEEIAYL